MPSMISEAAVQVRRIRDVLAAGNVLRPDDAATLHSDWLISEKRGIPIERALKLPARWRTQMRILDVFSEHAARSLRAMNHSNDSRRILANSTEVDRGNHRGTKR
jgi:hypothetical protein